MRGHVTTATGLLWVRRSGRATQHCCPRTCPARRYSVDMTGSGSFHRLYEGPLTILVYCSGLFS